MSEDFIPVNPFINAGALVSTYLIYKKFKDKTLSIIKEKSRKLMNNDIIEYDDKLIDEALKMANTNFAICYALKKNNIVGNDIGAEELVKLYSFACSLLIDTIDLANFSFVLSNDGYNVNSHKIIEKDHARIIRVLMAICGTYNDSGDFAIEVGLPAKSGVGGGLLATTNNNIGLATYSPGLDNLGNPIAAKELLKCLSKELNLNIY